MKIGEFLNLVAQKGRTNYFVLAPEQLGLLTLMTKTLSKVSSPEDQHMLNAQNITKEKARQIENEARLAPRAGSELQHFFIYNLHSLSTESVGPLLKAVEEAAFSRFIFHAQSTPKKIHTLMSRASVIRLPFVYKKVVLANMQRMEHDAKTADEMNLYDGTIDGTLDSLMMKDTLTRIKRDCSMGTRGLVSLLGKEVLGSKAFQKATYELFNEEMKQYLGRNPSDEKKKIALFLATREK